MQGLAALVGSTNRQAASQHLEDVRECGEDVRAFVLRQRKVDAAVVEGVLHELLQTPLAGPTELVARVNAQLGRDELTAAQLESALAQMACGPVLRTLRRQWAGGHGHAQEAHLLTEILDSLSPPAALSTRSGVPSGDRGMKRADPTALSALVTPDLPWPAVADSRCWLTRLMTLCSWHVPLSVLGRGCGVHKTTV